MNIVDFLDRMEILYPNESKFSDLRRVYHSHDVRSIFQLIDAPILEKFLLYDDVDAMFELMTGIKDNPYLRAVQELEAKQVDWNWDAISRGQLHSKIWLTDKLQTLDLELGTVFLCAGWYGVLATMLFERRLNIDSISSFDIDPDVQSIAECFNWDNSDRFNAITSGIHDVSYHNVDTVINTSCEHIDNFDDWYNMIPTGTLVALQSNNFQEIEEHVNMSSSLSEFLIKTPLSNTLYSGELILPRYTRFMHIGVK